MNYERFIYTVRNLVTNKLEDFHFTNLSSFKYDLLIVYSRQVESIDESTVDIDEITSRTGNPKIRTKIIFLTQWGDGKTLEPLSNVRRNETCNKYLEAHGIKHLIPREYIDGLMEV